MLQLKQVHAYTLRNGDGSIDQTKSLICHLLELNGHGCGSTTTSIHYADKLLHHSPSLHRSVFIHNRLIQAYSSLHQPLRCLRLFSIMSLRGCSPNHLSFTFLFSAVASLSPSPLPGAATALHARFLRSGFGSEAFALSALLDMYAKLRLLSSARQLFDEMRTHCDVPTWNSMVAGYARCGDMDGAAELFRLMPSRNVISWTTMVSGYSQNGRYSDALATLLRMEEGGLNPNEVTIASVLPACAHLGALETGERIITYARRNGCFDSVFVSNAVLDLYGRCGQIDAAKDIFGEIGRSGKRNSCSWNSMIMSLAIHGRSDEVLDLYNRMQVEGIEPEDITFVGLLLACTHAGLVDRGREIYESMERDHGIAPKLEHYGCMVDLLGRAGMLPEAYSLVQTMPIKPDSVIWGTLLGACSFHGNLELAEKAAMSLMELEPSNPGNYVILSNIYASSGKWDGVTRLRKIMRGGNIVKTAGYSCVEEGGRIHKFIVGDTSHLRSNEIYFVLDALSATMKPKREDVEHKDELPIL
ncbi:hypothetical protein SAY86_025858 [Trapa natans]|uniref:Pentatricopeptide repeat-containing protein n=1 Tax=Trapa natans TaxID=22666 RepID=A0AAN7KHK0_TRANT|nr:hypothetical protein SAY86_025858 [Trapa natans]